MPTGISAGAASVRASVSATNNSNAPAERRGRHETAMVAADRQPQQVRHDQAMNPITPVRLTAAEAVTAMSSSNVY